MGNESGLTFDLPALLRLNALDIRKVAGNNPSLHTGEYFDLLSDFIDKSPVLKTNFNNIASLNADENDFNSLEENIKLLENIGCYKFASLVNEIINGEKKGQKKAVIDSTKKILEEFDDFCSLIIEAKKQKNPEALTGVLNADDTSFQNDESLLLHKTLKLLDHYEATRKIRILAVDDAPIILKTISSVLGDDYKVYGMSDPTKLEKFLQQITPELFLLDYKMPELSGFDLIPIIRDFKEHKKTPIIFLTSSGTSELVSKAFALGACDYIVKPFQGKMLREKIAKHLGRKIP